MKLRIGQRVILLVLLCSAVSIVILSGISLYGMWGVQQSIVETGTDLGNSAADDSRQTLEEQAKQQLVAMAQEKARYTDLKIKNISDNVTILSREMTKIASNPDAYIPISVAEPRRENAGQIVPQLMYSASVQDKHDQALEREIGAAGNIQDFLTQFNSISNVVASSYIASKNGFVIMADKISDRKFASPADLVPASYEAFGRPWYIKASQAQKLVFTDVVNDINGGGLCIICAAPYTINGSFAGVVGTGAYLIEVNQIVIDTQTSDTRFGFILNNKGEVIISPHLQGELVADSDHPVDLRGSGNTSLAAAAKEMTEGKKGVAQVTLDGQECYLAYAPLSNVSWSFATVISKAEVIAPAVQSRENIIGLTYKAVSTMQRQIISVSWLMWLAALILLLLVGFVGWKLASRITQPIKALTDGVRDMNGCNLAIQLDIKTGDEIETLASSFNTMTKELHEYMDNLQEVTADKERIATELNVATNIQISMLPSIFPAFPERKEFDIYATMYPAKEVGGDFYDFYMVDDSHLAVVIADVSGKGVPAALFMVITKTIMKNFVMSQANITDIALAMKNSNLQLNENNDEMMFVTALMGILNVNTGQFTYVNAGHNPPLIYHKASKSFSYLKMENNCVLGIMGDMDFVQQELQMAQGDMLFFYTDGVTEAMDNKQGQYSEKCLLDCLNGVDKTLPLQDILQKVKESMQEHVGTAPQSDDITMMALKLSDKIKQKE